ncbi:MAG: 5-formyltetrahydrofolate cyclo-ligase [Promethearchaeota archaeon]|nr:MAG: 5-formyltetrahydrofolate cyclo-ligase [Candidatus Lokiarchaeota archaeon]
MRKQDLREEIKNLKMKYFVNDDSNYYTLSSQMVSNVLNFPLHVVSEKIALFASKKASFEIYTDGLVQQCNDSGKEVYLPRCITPTRDLEFVQIIDLEQDMEIGAFSLREPKLTLSRIDQASVFKNFDLVYVPGVAFDMVGNRLGFGSGYYDNFIKILRKINGEVPVVALAFDFQVRNEEIPHNAKDEKVDYIITPSSIFKTKH